ncbi:two component transcriptional regulator, luxr family [hydrocarbon metagenome]|uniref:Two component transcriptional regulator, luxr family n=1 Tax=hydrocarbon metagenome TaxID=938273 RepID=A0A0W8E2Q5_9ZZZZ
MNRIKLLLCSDSPVYTQSLSIAFAERYVFNVVDNVSSTHLINAALRYQPDVVLWRIDDLNEGGSIAELKSKCPLLMLVLIVEDPNKFNLFQLLSLGIRGCLPMRLLPAQIISSVELIVNAGILCLPRLGNEQLNTVMGLNPALDFNSLTMREREILSLLGNNCTNQEMAAALDLSESTIKSHLSNIFRKLKVRNRTEARRVISDHK